MLEINSEYKRVENLSEKFGKKFLRSRDYKDDREIYVLGAFVKLLKKRGNEYPHYFVKSEPPEPDFHTFTLKREIYKKIEIVENMHWGRKRGNEDKVPFDWNKYFEESNRCKIRLWYNFIKNLNDKFLKFYGNNTWLVMYHNINISEISDVDIWINTIFRMKDEIEKRGIVDFSRSTYDKVFVMNSGFTEVVQIYPISKVIFSKNAKYSCK